MNTEKKIVNMMKMIEVGLDQEKKRVRRDYRPLLIAIAVTIVDRDEARREVQVGDEVIVEELVEMIKEVERVGSADLAHAVNRLSIIENPIVVALLVVRVADVLRETQREIDAVETDAIKEELEMILEIVEIAEEEEEIDRNHLVLMIDIDHVPLSVVRIDIERETGTAIARKEDRHLFHLDHPLDHLRPNIDDQVRNLHEDPQVKVLNVLNVYHIRKKTVTRVQNHQSSK